MDAVKTRQGQRICAAFLTMDNKQIMDREVKYVNVGRQQKGLMQKLLTGEIRVKG